MFPPASSVKLFQFSLRLLFCKSINFLWLKINSLTLQDCFFPDHFLACGNSVLQQFSIKYFKTKTKGSLEPRQSSETLKTNSNYMKLLQSMGNEYKLVTIECGFTSHFSSLGITGKFHSFTFVLGLCSPYWGTLVHWDWIWSDLFQDQGSVKTFSCGILCIAHLTVQNKVGKNVDDKFLS